PPRHGSDPSPRPPGGAGRGGGRRPVPRVRQRELHPRDRDPRGWRLRRRVRARARGTWGERGGATGSSISLARLSAGLPRGYLERTSTSSSFLTEESHGTNRSSPPYHGRARSAQPPRRPHSRRPLHLPRVHAERVGAYV